MWKKYPKVCFPNVLAFQYILGQSLSIRFLPFMISSLLLSSFMKHPSRIWHDGFLRELFAHSTLKQIDLFLITQVFGSNIADTLKCFSFLWTFSSEIVSFYHFNHISDNRKNYDLVSLLYIVDSPKHQRKLSKRLLLSLFFFFFFRRVKASKCKLC